MAAPVFSIALHVGEGDIDALGHASNIAYVRWIQDVALAHSEAVGLGFEAYRELGAVFVVRRHEIDYLRPVVRGDRLEVRTWLDSAQAAKCKRTTEIMRIADPKGAAPVPTPVARAVTTWGWIELATGRPSRIPDHVRRAFGQSPARARA